MPQQSTNSSIDYFAFKSIYQKRIWGGKQFKEILKRPLESQDPIGESWDVVDRPEAQSIVSQGPFQGVSLKDLLQERSAAIMGNHWPENKSFPLLVKWLDCSERLSLQVHPPQQLAKEFSAEPKTENWYIAHTRPKAHIIAGFSEKYSMDELLNALEKNKLEKILYTLATQAGDSIFIPAGMIHAIGGGNLILEIQQNSDSTYRIFDWGRVGPDGKSRELHLEKSLQCIDFETIRPPLIRTDEKEVVLADCAYFRIRKKVLSFSQFIDFEQNIEPKLLSIISGSLRDLKSGKILLPGSTLLLPYDKFFRFESLECSTILITDQFNRL